MEGIPFEEEDIKEIIVTRAKDLWAHGYHLPQEATGD
jgi:hypothetical protein